MACRRFPMAAGAALNLLQRPGKVSLWSRDSRFSSRTFFNDQGIIKSLVVMLGCDGFLGLALQTSL